MGRMSAALSFSATALLAACMSHAPVPGDDPTTAPAVADLRVREGAALRPVASLTIPDDHKVGDDLFAYEGVGWENGFVGYRLYLDRRAATDIFGKRTIEPVLSSIVPPIGYHDLEDWGMDVLRVGDALGVGGLGVLRGGVPSQVGEMETMRARIDNQDSRARVEVEMSGFADPLMQNDQITASYSIGRLSPMSRVDVSGDVSVPLVAGIVHHPDTEVLAGGVGNWRYIATFGLQSFIGDALGMAVFFRADEGSFGGVSGGHVFVTYSETPLSYGFLATWEMDSLGIKTLDGFRSYLDEMLAQLENGQSELFQ